MIYTLQKILSSQHVIFCFNSSYTSAILGNLGELTGKTCKMIEPWSLNHPHGLLQSCRVDEWAGAED